MKQLKVYFEGSLVTKYKDYDRLVPNQEVKAYLVMSDKDAVIGSIPFNYMILREEKNIKPLIAEISQEKLNEILNKKH